MPKPVLPQNERRYFQQEIRLAGGTDNKQAVIDGYAAKFNSQSEDLGYFVEKIAPGAFANTIANDDIRALWNHNWDLILGRNKAGTLRLVEDDVGLKIEIDAPDTVCGRDAVESVRRGDVTQMSFGFQTIQDHWEKVGDTYVRTLLEVKLFEISPCVYPAYTDTSVSARNLDIFNQAREHMQPPPEVRMDELELLALRLRCAA